MSDSDRFPLERIVLRGLAAGIDPDEARAFAKRRRRAPAPLSLRVLDALDLDLNDNERAACRSVWQEDESPSRFWGYGSAVAKLADAASVYAAACDTVLRDGDLQRLPLRHSGLPKPVWHALLEQGVRHVDEIAGIDDLLAVSGIGVVGAAQIEAFVAALPDLAALLRERLAESPASGGIMAEAV